MSDEATASQTGPAAGAVGWEFSQHPSGSQYFGHITASLGRNERNIQMIRTVAILPNYGRPDEMIRYARLIAAAPDLLEVVKAFIAEQVDYMTRNNLGDPEKQHNIKWARAVLARATGGQP